MSLTALEQVAKRIQCHGSYLSIDELCLDNLTITEITKEIKYEIEKCESLEYLTMNGCSLKSLENFPVLSKLIALELIDNSYLGFYLRIKDCDIPFIKPLKSLRHMALNSNEIERVESLADLGALSKLEQIEV